MPIGCAWKTLRAGRDIQTSRSIITPASDGYAAIALRFRAPTLVPTIASGPSTPASNNACSTPTCAAPLAPPPPSTHVRRADRNMSRIMPLPTVWGGNRRSRGGDRLRPFLPRRQVMLLFVGQGVDLDAHGVQLEPRHLPIDFVRHVVDLALELFGVLRDVFGAQGPVGEAHVHHRTGGDLG